GYRTSGTHLILAVQCRDIEKFGVLGGVRMLATLVDAKGTHLIPAKRAAWDHALNGLLENALRKAAFQNLVRALFLDAAGITRVAIIDLVGHLLAGEADLLGVDDDDIVTAIDMRGEARLVLAAQDIGDERRDATNHQPVGIDQMPFLFH